MSTRAAIVLVAVLAGVGRAQEPWESIVDRLLEAEVRRPPRVPPALEDPGEGASRVALLRYWLARAHPRAEPGPPPSPAVRERLLEEAIGEPSWLETLIDFLPDTEECGLDRLYEPEPGERPRRRPLRPVDRGVPPGVHRIEIDGATPGRVHFVLVARVAQLP